MASLTECDSALRCLIDKLAIVEPEVRRRYIVERTVSCRISDLGVTYSGRLGDDGISELTTGDDVKAQLRLTVASDDLVALVEGRLAAPTAWAIGRLRIQASPLDLLKLRALL